MTATSVHAPPPPPAPSSTPSTAKPWLTALALRIHFYAAIFVGPFLLIAALSGADYALTPQVEKFVYADELTASQGPAVLLEQQIQAAQNHLGTNDLPAAVRPGSEGETTRVMFADPALGESETRAIFVDPATAQVTGDLTAYGTSGSLGVHTWVGQLHRNLHLGEVGRLYSELAASWLGVIALAGLVLWVQRIRKTRKARGSLYLDRQATGRRKLLSLHSAAGIWLALGFFFLSATGLTWSAYAGANVTELRSAIGWSTPSISTDLGTATGGSPTAGEHAEHEGNGQDVVAGPTAEGETGTAPAEGHEGHGGAAVPAAGSGATAEGFDGALGAARDTGLTAGLIEVKPPVSDGVAWTVTEIDRSWPTQVDAVAVDPYSFAVIDKASFDDYPFAAKLARWGIDAHMGVLFGLANQVVLAVIAIGLAAMIVWGYLMWIRRRPTRANTRTTAGTGAGTTAYVGRPPRRGVLDAVPLWIIAVGTVIVFLVGFFAPLLGISLLAFLAVDALIGHRQRKHRGTAPGERSHQEQPTTA
ncbi:hypothetical protein ASF21_16155 [Arthrobacter sp. Leaf234]|uniref:PepSY-associated TM helix domain-containing protein n=1 Tax=Arthrobacter sp. Leaf234 TaxID=1736303 RepID=UPI0006F84618|nr:PepSY-associated TM helix domain-containing protein [Arthrobacter sp. Leaf234]KQO02156.1 hypothetical protein ASF21_16155 [Arthrobacter sp. Leaf234]